MARGMVDLTEIFLASSLIAMQTGCYVSYRVGVCRRCQKTWERRRWASPPWDGVQLTH